MASFSDYLENKLLDHVWGNTPYTAPATVYLALFTSNPSDSGGGTEVSGGSYARKAVTNNGTNYPSASSGSKHLNVDTDFVRSTGAWGTITGYADFDALSGGNMLSWSPLTANKIVASGDAVRFYAGELIITLD